jgi:hypothetical protein
LGSFLSPNAAVVGRWVGVGLAATVLLYALISFIPFDRRLRGRATKDLESQLVEEIHVSEARVVEIGLISDNEPILAFDIGDSKLLLLQGQWLRDEDTYGAERLIGDPFEEFLNGLPAPYSFPSSEFTVIRLPHSGLVLGIRVRGAYLPPSETVEALKPEYEFGDSEVFIGQLEEVASVLASEHKRRFTT